MGNVIPLPRSEALNRPLRAALYGRASHDPKKRGRSIKDQFVVGEMECEDRGWEIHDYYEDRDLSASRKARKPRKDFERLVADIEAQAVDVVVYAERSRLSRTLEVSIKLRDLCERTGVLICYDGRVLDMRVPADRKEFTRDALQSEEEAETIIARADRTARLNAKRGNPHGVAPFGYRRRYDPDDGTLIGQEAHPEQAEAVRTAFQMIDEGKSLRSVWQYLRPFRPTITTTGTRVILTNRSYLGVRSYHGVEHKAQWPQLVEPALFHRVQLRLADPERRVARASGAAHLNSGIAQCAECRLVPGVRDRTLRHTKARDKKGYVLQESYRCPEKPHLSIRASVLDAFVEEAVLTFLGSVDAIRAFQSKADEAEIAIERTRIAAMNRQLDEAREQSVTFDETGQPRLSALSLANMEQALNPLIAAADKKLKGMLSAGDSLIDQLLGLPPEELELIWYTKLDLEQRRHILRRVVRIEVLKSPRRGRYQDPMERVNLLFVGEEGFDDWPVPGRYGPWKGVARVSGGG